MKIQIGGPADGPIKWYIIETLAVVFPELAGDYGGLAGALGRAAGESGPES